jgi:hypothetical protein
MASVFFEIEATLNLCLMMRKKFICLFTQFSLVSHTICIYLFCISFYIYDFYIYDIVKISAGFTLKKTLFNKSDMYSIIKIVQTLVKDVFSLIILLTLDALILASLNDIAKKRQKMNFGKNLIKKSYAATKNKAKMITGTVIVFSIGHLLNVIYNLPLLQTTSIWKCYVSVVILFLYISYSSSIIFFIIYNKIFKKNLIRIFKLGLF